jgi:hypothetical protein
MHTFKRILAGAAIVLAAAAIVGAIVGIYYAWAFNTPVTESLTGVLAGTERVLAVADGGLTRVGTGIETARAATSTIEGAVMAAGDTIMQTDIAFTVLERTVGDTLFPALVQANETAATIAGTVVAANQALEAANQLPFVEVPTYTAELERVAEEVAAARQRVEEIRGEVQALKENAVARPVTAITDRTQPLLQHLDTAQTTAAAAQTAIAQRRDWLAATQASLPRTLDRLSLALTVVLLWTVVGQVALVVMAATYLRNTRP